MERRTVSLILIFLGLFLTVIAIIVHFVLPGVIDNQVVGQLVIDSSDHPYFRSRFLTNRDEGAPAQYQRIHFYNILNVQEFLYEGKKPLYEHRGPYTFKEIYMRHNVTYSADRQTVSAAKAVQNVFVPEMSNGTLEDKISIINLPYTKVMSQVGSEFNLMKVAGVQALPVVHAELTDQMIPAIINGAVAQGIDQAIGTFRFLNMGRDKLYAKMGGECYSDSCITTSPVLSKYRVLLHTQICNCRECECTQHIIPKETMWSLFDSSDEHSILNPNQGVGINYWLLYFNNNQTNYDTLSQKYNLTDYQMTKLNQWLVSVSQNEIIREGVFGKLNTRSVPEEDHVTEWTDIPYRQLVRGDVLSLLLNNTDVPISVQPGAEPELPFFVEWARSSKLLANISAADVETEVLSWNLSSLKCIHQILTSDKSIGVKQLLGFDLERPGKAASFLREYMDVVPTNLTWSDCFTDIEVGKKILISYATYGAQVVAMPRFKAVAEDSFSGLVATRTVEEHVLGAVEPLLKLVLEKDDPRYQAHAILRNDPSLDDAPLCRSTADMDNDYTSCRLVRTVDENGKVVKRYERAENTYYTGVKYPDRIMQMKLLNGNATFDNVFAGGNLTIDGGASNITHSIQYGFSEGQNFPPLKKLKNETILSVYVPSVTAPLHFRFDKEVNDLYGITMKRFVIKEDQFTPQRPDAFIYSMYPGSTPQGLLNISDSKDLPVFISPVNYNGYTNNLKSNYEMDFSANGEDLVSYLDVEPISGSTMRARIRGQVVTNFAEVNFNVFYPKMYKTSFLPVMYTEVQADIPEKMANDFKIVYTAEQLGSAMFYGGLGIGILLFVSGVVLFFLPDIIKKGNGKLWSRK